MTTGLLLVVLAGLMNGSFATPMKRVRGWAWEHTWSAWALSGCVIIPVLGALATLKEPWRVYAETPRGALAMSGLFGLVWGVAAVLFGLGVARVGLAIGFGVILGISATLGALIPLATLHPEALLEPVGILTMCGVAAVLAGVACCAAAGRSREATLAVTPSGLAICILSGLGAPLINIGLAYGSAIVETAQRLGASPLDARNAIWPVLLGAAFPVNAGYCLYLMKKRSGFAPLWGPASGANFALGSLMGLLWMGSNFAYAYGSAQMGPLGLSLGWPIMMGCVVLTANGWGAATGEWKGAGARAKNWMLAGVALLVAGIVVISLAGRA